jgi:hypothetical protein
VEEMNAQIESATMRIDRDAFLCGWVHVKRADGFSQGFGGHVLGGIPGIKAGEHGTQRNLAAMWLVGVMRAADVDDYAKAVGKIVRIRVDKSGFGGSIVAIGHPLEDDRWFTPEEAFAKEREA